VIIEVPTEVSVAWIDLPADDADKTLEKLTKPWVSKGLPVPSVVAVMKPSPATFRSVMRMNSAVTFGGSVLGRRTEELIAASVSTLNDCFY
jgi:hypothetical protein